MRYPRNRILIPLYLVYKLLLLIYAFDLYVNVEPEITMVPLFLLIAVLGFIAVFILLLPDIVLIFTTVCILLVISHLISEYTYGDFVMRYFLDSDSNYDKLPFWDLCYLYIGIFVLILEPFSLILFKKKKDKELDKTLLDDMVVKKK